MAHGKTVQLYFMDSSPIGRVKCTLANWTGIAYKIPRVLFEHCKEQNTVKYLAQSGVYFLFGLSEEAERDFVYIGQAGTRKNSEGILLRLKEHKGEKDEAKIGYWNEAVVFTTSNNSFGPTEISYLENQFYNLAKEANRYEVKNNNDPTSGNVTEEKESELEEFIEYAQFVMGALGYKVFEPLVKIEKHADINGIADDKEILLHMKRKSKKSNITIEADCKRTNEGFVVLKGSTIELVDSDSIPLSIKKKRKTAKINDDGILQEDTFFKSPSYAAAFVIGGHTNGLTNWKTVDGQTLKELENNEMNEA